MGCSLSLLVGIPLLPPSVVGCAHKEPFGHGKEESPQGMGSFRSPPRGNKEAQHTSFPYPLTGYLWHSFFPAFPYGESREVSVLHTTCVVTKATTEGTKGHSPEGKEVCYQRVFTLWLPNPYAPFVFTHYVCKYRTCWAYCNTHKCFPTLMPHLYSFLHTSCALRKETHVVCKYRTCFSLWAFPLPVGLGKSPLRKEGLVWAKGPFTKAQQGKGQPWEG
jgi:hypothetical protein